MRHRIHHGHPRLAKRPLEARSYAIAVGSLERGQAEQVATGSMRLEPREQLSSPCSWSEVRHGLVDPAELPGV